MSGDDFSVPSNVFVVGTMNTADRSIALLDVALRRRFGFVELMPDYDVLRSAVVEGLHLGAWLKELNGRIRDTGGGDARNRQIGHAFLLDRGKPIATIDQFASILRDDIIPLLEEYAYDDFGLLAKLLGHSIVDREAQRVRRELFDANRSPALISALNAPEVATAAETVTADPDGEIETRSDDDSPDEIDEVSDLATATGTPEA